MAHNRQNPNTAKIRAAVMASGDGSNAENIIRFCARDTCNISITRVITNRTDAGVIARCARLDVPCDIIPVPTEGGRAAQEKQVLRLLQESGVEWVFLAGYMQLLSPDFLQPFTDAAIGISRIVNIHPSLLPAFPGKDAGRRAYDAQVETAGVTLHFVDAGMDTGPVILQRSFRNKDMDFDSFRAAGQTLEYDVYRTFLQHLSDGTWQVAQDTATGKTVVHLGIDTGRSIAS